MTNSPASAWNRPGTTGFAAPAAPKARRGAQLSPTQQAPAPAKSGTNMPTSSVIAWWRVVLVIVCLFVFAKQSGTVTWVLVSEIFPAKVRGTALGIAVATLWLANALVSIVFPVMMKNLGGAGTYIIFAGFNVLSLLFYLKVVPETRYHSLEELEMRFQKEYS